MVGAIIRGVLKSKIKPKPKSQYPKKVSRVLKKSKLKREAKVHPVDKYLSRKAVLGGARAALMKKTPILSKFEAGAITGGAGVLGTQAILKRHKAKKDAQAKLKKATEEHKKKTQKKREKYGKHHG